MEITQVEIKEFKKIETLTLDLEQVNFLIGGNNSGKSSVIQALHTAVAAAQTQIEVGGGAVFAEEALRYSPCSDFASIGHGGPLANRQDQKRANITFKGREKNDENNWVDFSYNVELYKGRNPRVVGVRRSGSTQLGNLVSNVNQPFSIFVPGLAGVPHKEEYISAPVVLRKLAGGEANLVLRNIIRQISIKDKLSQLVENLRQFFPGLDIRINYDPDKDINIEVLIRPSATSGYYLLEMCGTGILQALQIFAYTSLFSPELLLLDEPDSHLHPSNQIKLVEAVELIADLYGTQTIIATHSRHLMSAARNEAKFFWLNDGKLKANDTFELAEVLMDLGGLDQVDKILNSKKEFLFFVEDKKQNVFKILLSCMGIQNNRYEMVSYNGTSNFGIVKQVIASLLPYLQNKPKIIVHHDRDFMEEREVAPILNAFDNQLIKIFLTSGSDLEHYFINSSHISHISHLSEEDVNDLIKETLSANEEVIRARFKNKRREINKKSINQDGQNTSTDVLCPPDQDITLNHVVGKDFCSMFKKATQDRFKTAINPIQTSNVLKIPELLHLLES